MTSEKRRDARPGIPGDVSVRLERGEAHIGARREGVSEEEQFLEEVRRLGVDTSDLDRPLSEMLDTIGVIQCVAVAEVVWKVELGPRSGTVSEMGELAYEWPSLRALIDAAKAGSAR